MQWKNIRPDEFCDAVKRCNGVCVIPIGAMEVHGVHLPLGCDTIKAADFSIRAAEKEPVCVFPEMYFGDLSGDNELPGSIIFPPEFICEILEHSCSEIARNGFSKIVLVSSHGGNTAMLQGFARNMLQKRPDIAIYYYYQKMAKPEDLLPELEKYPYLTADDIKILQDYVDAGKFDGHGGFAETGCIYDICPEYVDLDKIDAVSAESTGAYKALEEKQIFSPLAWLAQFPNSYSADVHHGMNERIARAIAEKTIEGTAEAFKVLREETESLEYHAKWLEKQ